MPSELARTRKEYSLQSLDDYITDTVLNSTVGTLLRTRVTAPDARTAFVANTICAAIFDLDIGLISEIVKRIDGLAPSKGDMDTFSNIFSDALDDVLSYTDREQTVIYPDDPPIIALAKATMAVSMSDPGRNMQARKDRQKAVQMVLDRVEGRMSEPAKPQDETVYSVPEWVGLPRGEEDGERDDEAEGVSGSQG